MEYVVRSTPPSARVDSEEIDVWIKDIYSKLEDIEKRISTPKYQPSSVSGGGAPSNASYLTVGTATGIPNYRRISHDATLSHIDGGAGNTYTLGVTSNGHRHIEENIDETNYLVVDAGGRGDFATIQAAIDYMDATGGGPWTVVIRNGSYNERMIFNTPQSKSYNATFIGLGRVTITVPNSLSAIERTNYYNDLRFFNITWTQTTASTNGYFIDIGNGNSTEFHNCTLQPGSGNTYPGLYSGNGGLRFVHCTIGVAGRAYGGLVGSPGVSSLTAIFEDCLIQGNAGGYGLVMATTGNTVYLLGCRVVNGGAGLDLQNQQSLYVGRSTYNTTKTTGTITILDGDVPASALAGYVPTSRTIGTTAPLGGGGDLSANRTLTISQAGSASDGYLSSADWTTFNNKQPAGNYLTALTGDVTATGPGSAAATLATVNANVGTFGSATQVAQVTANAKGLITAISNVTITGASPIGAALTRGSIWRGSAANLAEAYALGAANKVLQSDGTDAIWSANTLTISGNSTINGSLIGNITGGGTLATTSGQTYTFGTSGGTIPTSAGTLTVSTANAISAAGVITHAITSSSNPGAAASILASSASGGLQLVHAGLRIAPDANILLYASHTWDGTTTQRGMYSLQVVQPAGNSSQEALALQFGMRKSGNFNFGNLYGVSGSVADFGGAGTINNAYAIRGQVSLNNASGTGGITSGYVFIAEAVSRSVGSSQTIGTLNGLRINGMGAAYITNAYGLYIAEQSGASSLNYSIYGNAGLYRFGDQLSIVGSADRSQLIVTGHTTQTATVASIARNDGATNTANAVLTLGANSTGTAADGFGGAIALNLESSTTADQAAASIKWLWSTATHASRKAKMQLAVNDTAERLGLAIEADGVAADVYFEGGAGSGLPYGGCWGNEIGWTQATAVQNTWYVISDTDMSDATAGLNLITHDGSGRLTVTKAGRYLVNYSVSLECSVLNKHIQTGIAVNGTIINDGMQHYELSTPNAQVTQSSTAIVSLAASGYVEVAVRTTDTGTPDLSVDHLNITLVQIGG